MNNAAAREAGGRPHAAFGAPTPVSGNGAAPPPVEDFEALEPQGEDLRWSIPSLPPNRDEAVRLAARRVTLPKSVNVAEGIDRPATLLEKLDACRDALHQTWRDLGIPPVDPDTFEADCCLTLNRARGWGFLAPHLPPASRRWSDLILNSDGSVWTRARGGRYFGMVHAVGELTLNEVWTATGNLLVSTGDNAGGQARTMSTTHPSLDTKLTAPVTGPQGENLGLRPVARIKIQDPVIAAGQGYPALAMRFHADRLITPDDLRRWRVAPDHVLDGLLDWTARGRRLMIGGGTATGKTTILAALLQAVPARERVVKIEDPEEIWCSSPNVQTLEARRVAEASGMQSFTVADGVDDAMRMAPDRLIVGEVREGGAAMALFRAMMSDHSGMTTFHSDSPMAMMRRLGSILRGDVGLPADTVPSLTEQAVDVYVQIGWAEEGDHTRTRAVLGVYELVDTEFIEPADAEGVLRYQGSNIGFRTLWRMDRSESPLAPLARRLY